MNDSSSGLLRSRHMGELESIVEVGSYRDKEGESVEAGKSWHAWGDGEELYVAWT